MTITEQRAKLTTAARNALPDSAFAYISADGTRHFPIHDANHVRNALARIAQGARFGAEALPKVKAAAKKFGIDTSDSATAMYRKEFELRARRRGSMIRAAERRGMLMEMRAKPDGAGGTVFEFEGYGSVFDTPFSMWDKWGEPYTEVVVPGAFRESLSRPDLDVPFLIGHDDSRLALARTRNGTMQLSEDSRGLHVRAQMDGRRTDVRDLAYAVERGDMDEMSIGFVTRRQQWSEDYETRSMLEMDLHRGDVSSVPLAALPATAGATMTALPAESLSQRAAVNAAAGVAAMQTADDADHDHMTPEVGPDHGPMTGTHVHDHPAFGAVDGDRDGSHQHEHTHSGDADHHHPHNASTAGGTPPFDVTDSYASGEPRERRGNPVDADLGDAPDYNPFHHAEPGTLQCGNEACPVPGGALNHPSSRFCSQCGTSLYGGDALVRLDDAGIPAMQEEQGAAAALALKRRQLEILSLSSR